jgi:hypothetical protein
MALLALGIMCLVIFWLWYWIPIMPSNAHFHRVHVGMTLPDAERYLGPAGLSLSSETSHEY